MTLRKEESMKIRLIRHFATAGNLERRYIGRTDEPILRPRPESRGALEQTEYIVSSPMLRCRQTAEVLFGREPDAVCSLLCETDFGTFEGKNYEELRMTRTIRNGWIPTGQPPFREAKGAQNLQGGHAGASRKWPEG